MSTPAPPTLQKPKHVKYWLRCLRTCLPTDYTSTDLNRLTLGFFCIAALDLLGSLHSETTEEDRAGWISWIYKNQLPTGGFRGSPAADLGEGDSGSEWDPPIVPASYFALVALVSLGDDLGRVKKRELLELLPKVQRKDGSFGEWLGGDGQFIGGSDMRFVYCAVAIRWILRGREGKGVVEGIEDIDVEGVIRFIRSAESYEHGISDKAFGEAHAGLTYCAIGALALLGRLHPTSDGLSTHANILRWLTSRQVPSQAQDELRDEEYVRHIANGTEQEIAAGAVITYGADGKPLWAGFNGRCNKKTDTCYSFWVCGSLDMMKKLHLIDFNSNRRFLLEKTQHFIGGFAKLPVPGTPPDILHSFMGLASLALMREEGLNRLDPTLCISMQAKERLVNMDWWRDAAV
ncbi:terpenoid cyclases/Protein prenyltransferase [Tuber magnatum]|uniref:Terpenoid cyclases/Protein prenyltransferase n=1 Tax=Tuber magnatum TaxID=42249 RepID=A0A317SE71_9PEZI|nr:terpenoid cyclases/Protein prenyltransferase [Tuber magnatum]